MTNRIEKSRGFIYVAIVISLLSDAASIGVLIAGGISPIYDLFMIGIAALDLLMFLGMRFSNPRVRSTIWLYVIYAALLSGASFALAFIYGFTYVDKIMTTVSAAVFLGCHLITALLTVLICVGSRFEVATLKKGKLFLRVLLSLVFTVAYLGSVAYFGFFGQGFGNRELIYEYDDATDSYHVTGLTDGKSKTVVIPETFDGKPVSAMSVTIFNDDRIAEITIEKRSETLTLLHDGSASFSALESLKNFHCSKDDIDAIKRQFYAFGSEKSFEVANMLLPDDLAEDEVFVSFALERSFTEATGDYLRTWIQPKGTVFSLNFDGTTEYSVHTDPENVEDLEWNYLHNNGVILTGVYDEDVRLDGVPVNENVVGAVLHFDRVWQVIFDDDNDTVYDLPQAVTCDTIDGEVKEYRYVLLSRANELHGLCDQRTGFSLRFLVDGRDCPSFADYLSAHPNSQKSAVHIVPEWTMDPVSVTGISLAAGSTAPSLAEIIYGDNVSLQCAATGMTEGFTISYTWEDGSNVDLNVDSDTLQLQNIHPVQAGNYKVTVTKSIATSSLTVEDSMIVSVPVNPRQLDFEWTSAPSVEYSGTVHTPTAQFNAGQVINSDAVTFSITVDSSTTKQIKNAGTYELKVVLASDMTGKYRAANADSTMTVTKKAAGLVWSDDSYLYDGASHRPTVTDLTGIVASDDVATLMTNIGYVGAAAKNYRTTPYTVTASVSLLTNYSFASTTHDYEITKREITIVSRDTDTFVYNGGEQYTKVTELGNVVDGEEAATLGILIYTREGGSVAGSSKNAGNYYVTVSLPDVCNYTFRGDVVLKTAFTVQTTPLTVTAENKAVVYGSSAPNYTVSYDGFVGGETAGVLGGTPAFNCAYAAGSNVGDYTITPSGLTSSNYNISFQTGTLTVGKKALTVKAVDKSATYGDAAPSYTVSYNGFVLGQDASVLGGSLTLSCSYAQGNNATTYPITPSGLTSSNYEISFQAGTLTVGKKALTVKADNKNATYGDAAPSYTVSYNGFVLGQDASVLGGSLQYTCNYSKGSAATTYTITPKGLTSSNYNISFQTGTLTVGKKALTVTAVDKNVTYGDAVPTYTANYAGFISGENASLLGWTPQYSCTYKVGSNVGEYTITPSGITTSNYQITYVAGTLTVAKKALTVTAVDKTTTYGSAAPTYTASYNGLAAGDTASKLGWNPTFSCSYAAGNNVGSYTITPSGVSSSNYNISFQTGTLTVGKKSLTVKADDKSATYGDAAPSYTVSYSGFVLGQDASALGGSLTVSCNYAQGNNAATYKITPSGLTSSNYQISFQTGTLTVGKKSLTVKAEDKNATYGDAAPTYTVSYSGFVLGQTSSVLGGSLQFTCGYAQGSNASTYTITPKGLTSSNYEISFQAGTLTVGKKALTVKADNKTVTYGDAAPVYTASYTGFVLGQSASVLGGTPTFNCSYESGSPVGDYPIQVSGLTSNNYSISYQNGVLTVEEDS